MRRTGEKLIVRELRPEPLHMTEWQPILDKKVFGKTFRRDAKAVENALGSLSQDSLATLAEELETKNETTLPVTGLSDGEIAVKLTKEVVKIDSVPRVEHVREYTPNVIEPSFGIGRILYSLLEQVYWHRPDDVARGVSESTTLTFEKLPC